MKRILTTCILTLLLPLAAFATPYYDTGSQLFAFKIGGSFPAFTYFPSDGTWLGGQGEGNTGMTGGGYGSISYQKFTTPSLAIGGEIGYDFNYSIEEELFTAVPFFAKATFFPLQGEFDIPLSVGFGGAYIKYKEGSLMTFFADIEAGLTWYPGENWGFGISSGFWLIPELNYRSELTSFNSLAGFVPLTLSITYRQ